MRILEGEKKVISNLLETIKADDRHKHLHVIHDQEIPERGFKGWNVVFANMESIDKSKLEGISDFLDKNISMSWLKQTPPWAPK